MSVAMDGESGKRVPPGSASDPEPAAPPSSAFHRVRRADVRTTEEDEAESPSPTPSSTASESRSPTVDGPRKDGQRVNGDPDRDAVPGSGDGGRQDAFAWPSHCSYDERRQLLGTEEESSDRPSSEDDEDFPTAAATAPDAVAKRSVWAITKEQLNYYTTQFFNMQPNPTGIIPGAQAKEFFEKSRLPINELRTIWQLSDVSKDGGLSLEEFLTAMHLVVLRRNDIRLPETLPNCLCPRFLKRKLEPRLKGMSEVNAATEDEESLVSSPKPVNFDFTDVRRDPNIVQPVALRLSPDPAQSSDLDETEDEAKRAEQLRRPSGQKRGRGEVVYEQLWNRKEDDDEEDEERPLRQQSLDSCGPSSLPPSQVLKKQQGQPPPPPPPRTGKPASGHTRSSSLDLNQYQMRRPPPAIPPRYHNDSPANLTPDEETTTDEGGGTPSPRGGGHAYIKNNYRPDNSTPVKMSDLSKDARSLQISIHEFKERNSVVARTINELHQEVSDILEERVALEYQLEQLKSFGE